MLYFKINGKQSKSYKYLKRKMWKKKCDVIE